jgi:peptide/nickel transport system substrate-binding protein
MKENGLLAVALMAVMLISLCSLAFATGPTQPPVDTETLYVGTIGWGPRNADPAAAYDTGSGELIFNSYETLISMGSPVRNEFKDTPWAVHEQYWEFEPKLATNVPTRVKVAQTFVNTTFFNLTDPKGSELQTVPPTPDVKFVVAGWKNNNSTDDVVGLLDVLYITKVDPDTGEILEARTWEVEGCTVAAGTVTLNLKRFYYDFNIRTVGLDGQPIKFFDNQGNWVGNLSIDDVEYSFERVLVYDRPDTGVAWMPYLYTVDAHTSAEFDTGDPADVWLLSHLIDDAYEIISRDPPVFRINLGIEFPDIAFKQIIAQTWSSIMDKEYSIAQGDWDGDLYKNVDENPDYPDWWDWPHWRETSYYDENWVYVGTGPYHVLTVDAVNKIVVLEWNPGYWMGWPAPGRKSFLKWIDIEYIDTWEARKEAFIACQLDIAAVPRAYMMDLLDPTDPAKMITLYPEIVTIKNIYPGLALDANHYTFLLRDTTTYAGNKRLPDGIPLNFFNYTDVRYAFSYAFNRTGYIKTAYFGEASLRETPLISGLIPDYYSKGPDPPYKFNIDYSKVKYHLKQARMNATGGQEGEVKSVWEWGFRFTATYNTGNEQRKIALNMLRDFFLNMSNDAERAGCPPFIIEVQEVDWPTYLTSSYRRLNPLWAIGWLSDYTDADNWMGAYMHSYVCFAPWQRYMDINGWTTPGPRTGLNKDQLIELAIKVPDGPQRAKLYADLDDIYLMDCPSLPLAEPLGRAWRKYWVKGWYYNGLYPALYYYHLYKENTCWCDVTGLQPGVPDGVTNMRDIGYIAAHFGARAPDPTKTPIYDPRWAPGVYGCGGADVYGDRKIDMRDVGLACSHFLHTTKP